MKVKNELLERIIRFSLRVIAVTKKLPKTPENLVVIGQIIRSSSSIGANYSEAIFAQSRVEFAHILSICRKESSETVYWLMMISRCNPTLETEITELFNEGEELLKIFISSIKTTKKNTGK
jgi:four helix bundle protein